MDHRLLLHKLYSIGIRGIAFNLISIFLENRTQMVRINSTYRSVNKIKTEVPQETILGPLLFLTYVNVLLEILPEGSIISYADNTTILASAKTWKDGEEDMSKKLDLVYQWLVKNCLLLNVKVYVGIGCFSDNLPATNFLSIKISRFKF